jgi:hypothetical protein
MKQPFFAAILHALAALAALLLGACASAVKSPVRNPAAPKCYAVDSTKFLTPAQHAGVFERVEAGGAVFRPCREGGDSISSGIVRIRPTSSRLAAPVVSYTALGWNVGIWGAGVGLGAAYSPWWLALPMILQAGPAAEISYEAEYQSSEGKTKREEIVASRQAWFESREESRELLLAKAPKDLSTALYGKKYPKEKLDLSGRISLNLAPILALRVLDDIRIAPRYEHLLPYNFGVNLAPQWILAPSGSHRGLIAQGGPRRYFFGSHAPVFLGVEPYYERLVEDGFNYSRFALPVTAGLVDERKGFFTGLDVGYGPAWVLEGAYKREKDYLFIALYAGWAF